MKTILPIQFSLSILAGPANAWGWGDCPHSKKNVNQEASTEKIEKSESSQKK